MNESAGHPAGGRIPADLDPEEADLAAWFGTLERQPPPPGVRAAVLAASRGPVETPAGRHLSLLARFPLGAWGVASAAMVLLAIGGVAFVEIATPVVEVGPIPHAVVPHDVSLPVEADPVMTLFHGLETFDEMGLQPGELIAGWGR